MTTETTTGVELDLGLLERACRALRDAEAADERFGTASAAQAHQDAYDNYRDLIDASTQELLRRARQLEAVEVFLREHGERLALFADWAAMRMCATEGDEEVETIKRELADILRTLGLTSDDRKEGKANG